MKRDMLAVRCLLVVLVVAGAHALAACGAPTPVPPTRRPVWDNGTEVYLVNKAGTHVTVWPMTDQCQWQFGSNERQPNGVLGIITNFCYTDWDIAYYYEIKVPGSGVIGWVRAEDLVLADQYTPEPTP